MAFILLQFRLDIALIWFFSRTYDFPLKKSFHIGKKNMQYYKEKLLELYIHLFLM